MNQIEKLRKNQIGRFEVGPHELTCGDLVELQHGRGEWDLFRVEANSIGLYYGTNPEGTLIFLYEGQCARILEKPYEY